MLIRRVILILVIISSAAWLVFHFPNPIGPKRAVTTSAETPALSPEDPYADSRASHPTAHAMPESTEPSDSSAKTVTIAVDSDPGNTIQFTIPPRDPDQPTQIVMDPDEPAPAAPPPSTPILEPLRVQTAESPTTSTLGSNPAHEQVIAAGQGHELDVIESTKKRSSEKERRSIDVTPKAASANPRPQYNLSPTAGEYVPREVVAALIPYFEEAEKRAGPSAEYRRFSGLAPFRPKRHTRESSAAALADTWRQFGLDTRPFDKAVLVSVPLRVFADDTARNSFASKLTFVRPSFKSATMIVPAQHLQDPYLIEAIEKLRRQLESSADVVIRPYAYRPLVSIPAGRSGVEIVLIPDR